MTHTSEKTISTQPDQEVEIIVLGEEVLQPVDNPTEGQDLYTDEAEQAAYQADLADMLTVLEHCGIHRFVTPVPNIPLDQHEAITQMVIAHLQQHLTDIQARLTEETRQTYSSEYLERAVHSQLGRFMEEQLLGRGTRKDKFLTFVGPVNSRLSEMKVQGVEIFVRSKPHSWGIDGCTIWGIREDAAIDGKETFAQHEPTPTAVQLFARARHELLYELMKVLGRPAPVEETRRTLPYTAYTDEPYAANPLSYPTDIIFYPHPTEWDEANNTFYNDTYLDRSEKAKSRARWYFEAVTGKTVEVTRSVAVEIRQRLTRENT
jgi:hypothetical protein